MNDPASALAELMNRRRGNHAADPPLGAPPQGHALDGEPPATENFIRSGSSSEATVHPLIAQEADTRHVESIAALVCELLGARVKPWLTHKLRDWPHVLEDADDLGQLAALAFVEGYRQGRVKPDPEARRHTASSVSAYLWGICNHIFIDTLRRNRPANGQQEDSVSEMPNGQQESSPLQRILLEAPEADEEARLWEVLAAVRSRCKPQDIVMTYLLGCGFSSGEIRRLLEISINMPAIAIKRVGRAVRDILGLDPVTHPEEPPGGMCDFKSQYSGVSPSGSANPGPSPLSTLSLLLQKSFAELVQRLDSPQVRSAFLREAVAALGPAGSVAVEQSLADRRYEMRADGDWSWGLLSVAQRRALLLKDAKLLLGAGVPDEGAAQQAALKKLVAELGSIFEELDQALLGDDLDWLLPLAEHLHVLLGIISDFKEMRQRYRALLKAARRLGSQRLEMLAQLGLGKALRQLGENTEAREALELAAGLARELNEQRGEANALNNLAKVLFNSGKLNKAEELHRQALKISRDIGDRHEEAVTVRNLAIIHCVQGDDQAAMEEFRNAISISHNIGDRNSEAVSLQSLGNLQRIQGNYCAARALYEQALALGRELGDRSCTAICLGSLAINESMQGNYSAARTMYEQALTLFRELGDRRCEAIGLHCLGYVEFSQGNFGAARELQAEALGIRREIGYLIGIRDSLVPCVYLLATCDQLSPAALCLYGAMHHAEKLNCELMPTMERELLEQAKEMIEHPETGLAAEERKQLKAQAEAMSLDELAEFALAELAKI